MLNGLGIYVIIYVKESSILGQVNNFHHMWHFEYNNCVPTEH